MRLALCTMIAMLLHATGCAVLFAQDASAPGQAIRYGEGEQVGTLGDPLVKESSGLAWGWRNHVLWTHNDSGGGAILWAFDTHGKRVARVQVTGASNRDWEDMASFQLDGKSYLLIAETGNNNKSRRAGVLYILEEPAMTLTHPQRNLAAKVLATIEFHFADKPQDCEAVAVDPIRRKILLVSKELGFWCTAYELDLTLQSTPKPVIARKLTRTEAPVATGMDISPDGRRAVLCTYTEAWEFTRIGEMTWADAFAAMPRRIAVPDRRQGESICFGADGKTLYLTSEKTPAPLFRVPVVTEADANTTPAPQPAE